MCSSDLVQGLHYYKDAKPGESIPGLMNVEVGPYHIRDIEIVAAFDIDSRKVGQDLAEAIVAKPNNTIQFARVPTSGVVVQRGPTLDGIFTQSNYGIVTKMGMWLMPAPPDYRPFLIQYPEDTDITKIVDALRPLRIAMVIPNAVVIAHTLWEAPCTKVNRADYHPGPGAISDEAVQKIRKDHNLGAWNVYAALYGTPETNAANWKIIEQVAAATGGTLITDSTEQGGRATQYRFDLMKGKPNLGEFDLYNWRGGGGSMWFAPVSQAKGSETLKQMQLAKRILGKHGFDYVGEFIVGWRDMHHVIDLLYDRTDPEQMKAAYACYDELVHAFAEQGYGVYRTSTAFAEKVAATYGPVKREVERRLKKALDPNNILAPGRCGISL